MKIVPNIIFSFIMFTFAIQAITTEGDSSTSTDTSATIIHSVFPTIALAELKAGTKSNINVMDTSGCYIIINRNGNIVNLKKDIFKQIILGNDTIDLSTYECLNPEKPAPSIPSVTYFNRDQLYRQISKMQQLQGRITPDSIFFFPYPLKTQIDKDIIDSVSTIITSYLSKYPSFKLINEIQCANLIVKPPTNNSIMLICTHAKYATIKNGRIIGDMSIVTPANASFYNNPNTITITDIELVAILLSTQEIIFSCSANENYGADIIPISSKNKQRIKNTKLLENSLSHSYTFLLNSLKLKFSKRLIFGSNSD